MVNWKFFTYIQAQVNVLPKQCQCQWKKKQNKENIASDLFTRKSYVIYCIFFLDIIKNNGFLYCLGLAYALCEHVRKGHKGIERDFRLDGIAHSLICSCIQSNTQITYTIYTDCLQNRTSTTNNEQWIHIHINCRSVRITTHQSSHVLKPINLHFT